MNVIPLYVRLAQIFLVTSLCHQIIAHVSNLLLTLEIDIPGKPKSTTTSTGMNGIDGRIYSEFSCLGMGNGH